jgi:hypothetical protein
MELQDVGTWDCRTLKHGTAGRWDMQMQDVGTWKCRTLGCGNAGRWDMKLQDVGVCNCRTLRHGNAGRWDMELQDIEKWLAGHAICAAFVRHAYVVLLRKCGGEKFMWDRREYWFALRTNVTWWCCAGCEQGCLRKRGRRNTLCYRRCEICRLDGRPTTFHKKICPQ